MEYIEKKVTIELTDMELATITIALGAMSQPLIKEEIEENYSCNDLDLFQIKDLNDELFKEFLILSELRLE